MSARPRLRTAACVVLSVALAATAAQATIIDRGLTTLDTDSGLEWLDMSQSIANSAWAIVNRVDPRGLLNQGWRYATFTEIADLFTHAGMTPPYNAYLFSYNYAPAVALLDDLGATGTNESGGHNVYVQAIAPDGPASSASVWHVPNLFTTIVPGIGALAGGDIPSIVVSFTYSNPRYAHWLCRTYDPTTPVDGGSWGRLKSLYRR